MGDVAEVAKLSIKKIKNIPRAQTMSLDVIWAHFYVFNVVVEGRKAVAM